MFVSWCCCSSCCADRKKRPSSLHSCKKRSMRADECSRPYPSNLWGSDIQSLIFGGLDELVDDTLCVVCKISMLRLPHHQGARAHTRISIIEAHDAIFTQEELPMVKIGLLGFEIVQRRIRGSGFLVIEYRMALGESAPFNVLSRDLAGVLVPFHGEVRYSRSSPCGVFLLSRLSIIWQVAELSISILGLSSSTRKLNSVGLY